MFSLHTEICGTERLRSLDARRVFIVADPFFVKNGQAARFAELTGGEYRVFDGVRPDPDLRCIAAGLALLEPFDPDLLIALGGGSAIDCAKGMLAMAEKRPRFAAIPTTSGTGSEVTAFAVLTHDGVKHPLVDPKLRPDLAILDASLLENLPAGLIADAGMDVLTHCAEAVAAKHASGFSTALAAGAFRTALELLPKSFSGDRSVRAILHEAATMAGAAFDQAGLGACHALAHAVGGRFHVPHGKLGGIFLPHVITFNAQVCPGPYEALAAACGIHGLGGLLAALSRLRRQLKLPTTLTQAGLSRSAVLEAADALAQAAVQDPCAATNPRPLEGQEAKKLLLQAL